MDPGMSDVNCRDCGSDEKLHFYPCRHCFCSKCLIRFNYVILKSFKSRLDRNIEDLQGKSSFLGCKFKCTESRLSMSLEYLVRKLSDSLLTPSETEDFCEIARIGKSFFSGINTNFFKCMICNCVKYCVEEKPVVCKDCIVAICYKQLESNPSQIFYHFTINYEEFIGKDYVGNNYFLAEYNLQKNCYEFRTINVGGQNFHRISKLKKVDHDNKVLLARGIESRSDEDYFYIEQHDDLQTICILTFYQ